MSTFDDIKRGLEEAILYEEGNLEAKSTKRGDIMEKYEIRTVTVESRNNEPLKTFAAKTNQDTELVASFDTEEEARAYYEKVHCGATKTSDHGMPLYIHDCKFIEIDEYNGDGEWIGGGDWLCYDFPSYETAKN